MDTVGIWVGAFLLLLLGIAGWLARRDGQMTARLDAARDAAESARNANEDREAVRRLPDRALDDELRGA